MKRALLVLFALVVAAPLAAQTNSIPCLSTSEELLPLPEAKADPNTGILRAIISTTAVQVRMPTGVFGKTPATGPMGTPCYPQWVREYKLGPNAGTQSSQSLEEPLPGPVFRASVGDMVQLTFLNLIDRNKFPNSDKGCDKTSTYPGSGTGSGGNVPDTYPDCFALSTWTNIHYHGSHTNPGSTGDNVFLEIQPSPRENNAERSPLVKQELVRPAFTDFFNKCQAELPPGSAPKQWPRFWKDLPDTTATLLKALVQNNAPDLWVKDQEMIDQGQWPQYFVGAYPYCFRLPKYTSDKWPPAKQADAHSAHTGGAGSAEIDEAKQPRRPLIMGQAPGTHWYHAHKHGSTTINVMNGMTGVFIMEDWSPTGYDGWIRDQYKSYGGIQQKVIVINQLGTTPSLERGGGGGPGAHFAVNGRMQPKITMKGGEVQLWRIANTSSRAGVYFVAPTGLSWRQTAQDGVQFDDSNYADDAHNLNRPITVASGNRIDLLVKAPVLSDPKTPATYNVTVMNTVDQTDLPPYAPNAASETLVSVSITENGTDMSIMAHMPKIPPYLTDITDAEIKGTKTLTFSSTAPGGAPIANNPAQHKIDGKKFDGEVGAAVRLNEVEEWKIVNETYVPNQISHPFHIHINPFQISEKFDPNAVLSSTAVQSGVTMPANAATVTRSDGQAFSGVKAGYFVWINGLAPSTVLSISSDNKTLTLNNAAGTTGLTAKSYTIAVPRYTIDASSAVQGQCVISPTDDKTWKPCFQSEPKDHRIWWDVFPIPSGNIFYANNGQTTYNIPGWFKMRSRFVDYAGYYVLHCHILAHEDRGMMTVVSVTPLQPPVSHH